MGLCVLERSKPVFGSQPIPINGDLVMNLLRCYTEHPTLLLPNIENPQSSRREIKFLMHLLSQKRRMGMVKKENQLCGKGNSYFLI